MLGKEKIGDMLRIGLLVNNEDLVEESNAFEI